MVDIELERNSSYMHIALKCQLLLLNYLQQRLGVVVLLFTQNTETRGAYLR